MLTDAYFTDPNEKLSKYFTWHEALFLPKWNRLANEADDLLSADILDNIKATGIWMDAIREYFDSPINIHCWFRPLEYNQLVGGAKYSSHLYGIAVDFDVHGMTCDEARQKLLDNNKLDELKLRMEQRDGSNWVHLDSSPLSRDGHRYFLP